MMDDGRRLRMDHTSWILVRETVSFSHQNRTSKDTEIDGDRFHVGGWGFSLFFFVVVLPLFILLSLGILGLDVLAVHEVHESTHLWVRELFLLLQFQ